MDEYSDIIKAMVSGPDEGGHWQWKCRGHSGGRYYISEQAALAGAYNHMAAAHPRRPR